MKVKHLLFVVFIMMALVFASCQPQAGPAADEKGSFAVVLTGPWDDNSWNEAGYLGMKALEADGVKVAYSESVAEGEDARVLRQYADEGYQMIVGHSFGYQDGVFEVAAEYPDINFAWAGGIQRMEKNVADYAQPFYEAAYPIGIIAGHMSETGKLGAIYGFDIPVCHAMGEAMLAGAKTVNPDATLTVTGVGDWIDVAKAKEAAIAQADTGVDFWIECGEGPALGTIAAAQEVGGYVTGYVGDMTENGPDVVLVNLLWNMEPMFRQMLADTLAGTFDAPWYDYGIKQDAMLVTYNDDLKDQIPAEAIEASEKAMADIKAGDLIVEFVPE
jgi:simple sugar transport system substrate-binding protein/basic membrane protein A